MLKISIEELPSIIKLAHRSKNNVLVVGDPGVGKSQVIGGMASDTCRTFSMTGSSTIEEYVNGIPQVDEGKEGFKQLEYVPSEWLVQMVLYGREHPDHMQILFLDEFNTADPQVLKTFLTILTERCIPTCGIKLPDNVVIVAAMNPQDQNEGEPLIRPLVSRFLTVEVRSSIDQYRKYIAGKSNAIAQCDFKMLNTPKELDLVKKDYMVRNISASDWATFNDGDYHEINPRSMDNFFRALSYCSNQKVCCPLLSQAFLGIKLTLPSDKAASNQSSSYLSAEELLTMEKDKLLEYAALICRDGVTTIDARKARLTLRIEMNRRGIDYDVQEVMGAK